MGVLLSQRYTSKHQHVIYEVRIRGEKGKPPISQSDQHSAEVFKCLIKAEKCSHSKKLQDLSKQHVDELPAQAHGGWMVPPQSVENREYFVVRVNE